MDRSDPRRDSGIGRFLRTPRKLSEGDGLAGEPMARSVERDITIPVWWESRELAGELEAEFWVPSGLEPGRKVKVTACASIRTLGWLRKIAQPGRDSLGMGDI